MLPQIDSYLVPGPSQLSSYLLRGPKICVIKHRHAPDCPHSSLLPHHFRPLSSFSALQRQDSPPHPQPHHLSCSPHLCLKIRSLSSVSCCWDLQLRRSWRSRCLLVCRGDLAIFGTYSHRFDSIACQFRPFSWSTPRSFVDGYSRGSRKQCHTLVRLLFARFCATYAYTFWFIKINYTVNLFNAAIICG